jgi:hypothetical protein
MRVLKGEHQATKKELIYDRHVQLKVNKNKGRTLFMFSPPKISWVISGIKYICLRLLPVFYLIHATRKQIICFDFRK